MPRFAILQHDWPTLHWDFLVEDGPILKAWRLLEEPCPHAAIPAEPNFDHRRLYLDYEGPVSHSRGTVTRWDTGTFEWHERGESSIVLEMVGQRITGRITLEHGTAGWTWTHTPTA